VIACLASAWLAASGLLSAASQDKKPAPMLELAGTTWRGALFGIDAEITFQKDGSLTYRRDGETAPGSWKTKDNLIWFEINKYSEHRGTISGDTMKGMSTNKGGQSAQFQLRRVIPKS
jgi:hypothetical protein